MSIINTNKNVYIIGAGFSKEIGLPLQDDFLVRAKDVYFQNTDKYSHFKKVFDYQDKLTRMKKFMSYPLLNLESLFNLLEMDRFYSESDDVESIKDDFKKMIKDVLINLTPKPIDIHSTGMLSIIKVLDIKKLDGAADSAVIPLPLENAVSIIVGVARPDKIILFGYYAAGNHSAGSDYDILVLKKNLSDQRKLVQKIYLNFRNIGAPIDS